MRDSLKKGVTMRPKYLSLDFFQCGAIEIGGKDLRNHRTSRLRVLGKFYLNHSEASRRLYGNEICVASA